MSIIAKFARRHFVRKRMLNQKSARIAAVNFGVTVIVEKLSLLRMVKRMSNPLEEIIKISHLIPSIALQDIHRRIGDWLASGGKENDPYIEQQLRFARRFVKDVG